LIARSAPPLVADRPSHCQTLPPKIALSNHRLTFGRVDRVSAAVGCDRLFVKNLNRHLPPKSAMIAVAFFINAYATTQWRSGHHPDRKTTWLLSNFCLHQIIMQPKLLDTIALVINLPHDRLSLVEPTDRPLEQLPIGLVGTIVHIYEQDPAPSKYLVEFSDAEGREEAMATLDGEEFVVLQYELAVA
jgi:hypothetical protein